MMVPNSPFTQQYMVIEAGVILRFSPFQQRFIKDLRVAPSQIFPSRWGSLRAYELIMRVFERPISVELFLYLFDVVRSPEQHCRGIRQGYIELVVGT